MDAIWPALFIYSVPALAGAVIAWFSFLQSRQAKKFGGASLVTSDETLRLLRRQLEATNKILDLTEARLDAHEAFDNYRFENIQISLNDLEDLLKKEGKKDD